MKKFLVRINNDTPKIYRAGTAAVAVGRALRLTNVRLNQTTIVEITRQSDVKYEYKIRADVRCAGGATVRTTLIQFGPYATEQECSSAIDQMHTLSQVEDGTWQFLRPIRQEKS